jgi:amino acid transporter
MLIVASIDSIRNLPGAALFGGALVFFFIASAAVFLLPTSLVAAELAATFPKKGGVYHWVDQAFGNKWALVAIWMQWINTMVWYPSILSFIAGTAAYLINPDALENKAYLLIFMLSVFWTVTLVNFSGIHFSSKINNLFGLIGTVFPLLLLIVFGAVWVLRGDPVAIPFDVRSFIPSFSDSSHWSALVIIMASFLGMELSGVHVSEIKEPQKNFPKALLYSALFILVSMVLGSLSIAFVIPSSEISLISGTMQVLSRFFEVFGMPRLIPVLSVLIVLGSTGSIINWLISPAKGLLQAAEFGYLPSFFTKQNGKGVPTRILLLQAVLVSLFSFVYLLVPGVNEFYWFVTALSTELYMIMYILMFLAALRLHYKYPDRPKCFKIPGGAPGIWAVSLIGCIACVLTIAVCCFPPEMIQIGSKGRYLSMVFLANLLTIFPVLLLYRYGKKHRNHSENKKISS